MEICFKYNLAVSAPEEYLEYPAWQCPQCDMYHTGEDWELKTLTVVSALSCGIEKATGLKHSGRYWFMCPNCGSRVLDSALVTRRRGREK